MANRNIKRQDMFVVLKPQTNKPEGAVDLRIFCRQLSVDKPLFLSCAHFYLMGVLHVLNPTSALKALPVLQKICSPNLPH